ncbi:MAG: hypothetical protein R2710_29850 [Acidimicrobiales bacterium]
MAAISAPVITAITPGRACAPAVSIETIVAWGNGLRTNTAWAMSSTTRSSM